VRFYGKKPLRNKMREEAQNHTETKYATLYSVSGSTATVKIQGSDELITCYYTKNSKEKPLWLRVGQGVQLRHTGGNRGRLEIFDSSMVLASPQAGSPGPVIPTPPDAITTGLQLLEIPNRDVMKVAVSDGRVRFSGTTSAVIYLKMTSPAKMIMGYGLKMGSVAEILNIDAAPLSGARYDLVVVGSDLVFDVVKGTASDSPSLPSVPSNHLQVGWILITAATTAIKKSAFNQTYYPPTLTSLTVVAADSTLDWGETSTTITVTAYDQYGNQIIGTGLGWYITATISSGTGEVDDQAGNSSSTYISKYMGVSASTVFGYTRNHDSTDQTASITFTVSGSYATGITVIVLLDISGDPM